MVSIRQEKLGQKSNLTRIVVIADQGKRLWLVPDQITKTKFEILEVLEETKCLKGNVQPVTDTKSDGHTSKNASTVKKKRSVSRRKPGGSDS